jgi:hypothetical protein
MRDVRTDVLEVSGRIAISFAWSLRVVSKLNVNPFHSRELSTPSRRIGRGLLASTRCDIRRGKN